MSLLSDLFIGNGSPALNPNSAPALTEVEVYRQMLRDGTINKGLALGNPGMLEKKMPGFIITKTFDPITVPDSANDVGGGGSSPYKGVVQILEEGVQSLAGAFITQGLTDAQVADMLFKVVTKASAWLGGLDPNTAKIPELVIKYTQAYRTAVTPV